MGILQRTYKVLGIVVLVSFLTFSLHAQYNQNSQVPTDLSYDSQGHPIKKKSGKDSLQHRDRFADSITIFYRYYDSTRTRTIDSSINDFTTRFPIPYTYETLGNLGTAARSMLFNPNMKAGWDAGFHQYDTYKYTVENTKFYQTTRPFTEMSYLLGSSSEQLIDIVHTQNKKSNFNFSVEYRFINAPGIFRTQNASHNNFRFTTHYQSLDKRYESFLIFISNKHASSENGGLIDKNKIDSLALNNPYELDTRLGNPALFTPNPFNTTVNTGNIYKESNFLYRHQYDLGTKDSIVTDSSTIKLFYPRFRIQHTLQFGSNEYRFLDNNVIDSNYLKYFNYKTTLDTLVFVDKWTKVSNEFSLISFPDKNNQSQYAKVGAVLQNRHLRTNDLLSYNFYDLSVTGEYRNRTRNKLWDVIANGQLYVNGTSAGDYQAYISLKRRLSKRAGNLQIGFQNVNRTPSFIYNSETAFPIQKHSFFAKENITHLFANYDNPQSGIKLSGDYYLVSNYAYSDSFFKVNQESKIFNVLHLYGEKVFHLSNHWNYYLELHLQQTTANAPINIPQIITRNRLAFEGNFFTNLNLSTGLEARYTTNYKSPDYSPFTGQFFYQDNNTLSNRPDVNFFFHFRIKSFKAFLRVENLNTVNTQQGFSFNHYNFKLPNYPNTGLWMRFGIWWNFIN